MDKEEQQSIIEFLKTSFDPEGTIRFLVVATMEQRESRAAPIDYHQSKGSPIELEIGFRIGDPICFFRSLCSRAQGREVTPIQNRSDYETLVERRDMLTNSIETCSETRRDSTDALQKGGPISS